MIKRKNGVQLWLLSAILLLAGLLCSIGVTGAWFTFGDGLKVECTVVIGQFNLKVSQIIGSSTVDLNTYDQTVSSPKYVDITYGSNNTLEILPDETYTLNLQLTNNDQGSESFYLRYKLTLYKCSKSGDVALNATFSGNDSSFVKSGNYYYYGVSASNLSKYESGKSLMMCSSFSIPYSEFVNNFNGENVRLEILVECSDTSSF